MHATEEDISLFISQKKVDLLARCLSPEQCAKRLAVQDAELKYCREQLAYLARCQADLAATQDVYEKVQAVHQKGLTSVAQVQKSLAGSITTSEYKRTAITAARAKNPIRPNDIIHYAQRLAYTTFAPLDVPLVHVDASSTWGKFSVSRQVKVNAPEMHASALYQWSAAHAAENVKDVKDVKDESSSLSPSSALSAAVRSWATYPFPPRKLRKRHLAEVDDNTHSNSSNNDHDTDARKEGQQSSAGERGLKYPALAQERHGRGMKGTNADEDEDEDDEDEDEEEQPSGGGNVFSLMQLLEGNAPAGAAASSMEEAEESSSDSEEDEQGNDFEFG